METPIKCPNCNSIHIAKDGTRNEKQRFKCKNKQCSYRFASNTKIKKNSTYFVTKAIQLWLEGLTCKGIAHILGFDEETISRWIKPYTEKLLPLRLDKTGLRKNMIRNDDIIVVELENSIYSSGILFKGNTECEIFGISRKVELK